MDPWMHAPILLLLHEGGWDEVAMVAIGLVAAYLIIVWTGRRSRDADDADDDQADDLAETRADDQSRPS
jgi:hypothetical protein